MSRFHQAWRAFVPVSVALALAVVPISLSSPVRAGTVIHVTTTADTLAEAGGCSLREATRAANLDKVVGDCPAGSGADTIVVPAGRYTLTIPGRDDDVSLTGDLDIASDVTIQGESATSTIIDGNRLDRIFDIARGAHVHLDRLTVYGGQSSDDQRTSIEDGGGILNRGVLLMTASVIDQNLTAASGSGGGIFNAGRLTIRDSTVSQNSTFDGRGGGIRSTGDAILKRVLVIYNEQLDFSAPRPSRDDPGSAGGVDASGSLVLSHSEVKFNHSNGIHTGGVTLIGGLISDSSIIGNGDTSCVVGGVTMVRSTMLRSVVGSNIGWCGLAAGIAAFDSEIVELHDLRQCRRRAGRGCVLGWQHDREQHDHRQRASRKCGGWPLPGRAARRWFAAYHHPRDDHRGQSEQGARRLADQHGLGLRWSDRLRRPQPHPCRRPLRLPPRLVRPAAGRSLARSSG